MHEHTVGSREEWRVARDELAKLEAEQAERGEEIKRRRRELPWVRVKKEYEFDTEDGKKTLAELFEGRSQLLAYNIMYGPDYERGACPGCTNLADGPAPRRRRKRAQARPASNLLNPRRDTATLTVGEMSLDLEDTGSGMLPRAWNDLVSPG